MRNVVHSLSLMALSFGVSIVLSLSQESFAQDVSAQNQSSQNAGAVFVMANDVSHNQVISYARAADGSLLETGNFATGGRGTGGTTDPLESQGSLVLSQDHSLLLAVNGGSGEVSTFHVRGTNLLLADRVDFRRERAKRYCTVGISCLCSQCRRQQQRCRIQTESTGPTSPNLEFHSFPDNE